MTRLYNKSLKLMIDKNEKDSIKTCGKSEIKGHRKVRTR